MTDQERAEFQQHCRDRWDRVKDALSWSHGPMVTWKPVMTEQQQREATEYRIKHRLPF